MSTEEPSARDREIARSKGNYDCYREAERAFDTTKNQIHMAMLFLRDMTGPLPMPDLIAAVGDVQHKLGVLFEELNMLASKMGGVADVHKRDYYRLTGNMP